MANWKGQVRSSAVNVSRQGTDCAVVLLRVCSDAVGCIARPTQPYRYSTRSAPQQHGCGLRDASHTAHLLLSTLPSGTHRPNLWHTGSVTMWPPRDLVQASAGNTDTVGKPQLKGFRWV